MLKKDVKSGVKIVNAGIINRMVYPKITIILGYTYICIYSIINSVCTPIYIILYSFILLTIFTKCQAPS